MFLSFLREGTRIEMKLVARRDARLRNIRFASYEFSKTISRVLQANETRSFNDETEKNEITKSLLFAVARFQERFTMRQREFPCRIAQH